MLFKYSCIWNIYCWFHFTSLYSIRLIFPTNIDFRCLPLRDYANVPTSQCTPHHSLNLQLVQYFTVNLHPLQQGNVNVHPLQHGTVYVHLHHAVLYARCPISRSAAHARPYHVVLEVVHSKPILRLLLYPTCSALSHSPVIISTSLSKSSSVLVLIPPDNFNIETTNAASRIFMLKD